MRGKSEIWKRSDEVNANGKVKTVAYKSDE